jgi:hypothetical protein
MQLASRGLGLASRCKATLSLHFILYFILSYSSHILFLLLLLLWGEGVGGGSEWREVITLLAIHLSLTPLT